jgi:Protein of unknown function (DUF3631)/Domain of unknown function (DUF3854)
MNALTTTDLKMFSELGVNPALLDRAKIDRVTDDEARELGLTGPGDMSGVIFPYRNGSETKYFRVRRDRPSLDEDGKPVAKYMAPASGPDLPRHIYYPPLAPELIVRKNVPAILVESEKASLALTAWAERTGQQYVTIALGGCYGWSAGKDEKTGEKILHADLQVCRDRRAYILMDSNCATSENVQRARRELVAALRKIGAEVRVLDLPTVTGANGPDDFLAVAGDAALVSIFDDQKVGSAVLSEVERFIRRFIVMSESQYVACTLWTAHTHAIEICTYTPYLAVTSAEKQSAKSQLLHALRYLVRRPWNCSGASAAVLFRKIAAVQPTLLLDEMDAILQGDKEMAQAVRGILNAGNEADAVVSRCEGKGAAITAQDYSVFCPKALAGIGSLPETVRDRSVPIRMMRKPASQRVAKLRKRLVQTEGHQLRDRLGNWIGGQLTRLRDAFPVMPDELSDRQQDGAEILFAIAEAAGGDWPGRTRKALLELFRSVDVGDDSNRMRMLTDLREIYNQFPLADAFSTSELLEKLKDIETSPWSDWSRGRGLSAKGLSDLLKPFGIFPGQFREKGDRNRGYRRADLEDAWSRYLPPLPPTSQNNPSTCATTNVCAAPEAISDPSQAPQCLGFKSDVSINENAAPAHVLGLNSDVSLPAPETTLENKANGISTLPEPTPLPASTMIPFLAASAIELTDDRQIFYGEPPDLRPGRAGDVGMADDESRKRRNRYRRRS